MKKLILFSIVSLLSAQVFAEPAKMVVVRPKAAVDAGKPADEGSGKFDDKAADAARTTGVVATDTRAAVQGNMDIRGKVGQLVDMAGKGVKANVLTTADAHVIDLQRGIVEDPSHVNGNAAAEANIAATVAEEVQLAHANGDVLTGAIVDQSMADHNIPKNDFVTDCE